MFWRRRRLHMGFESFLEYRLKRRMHRKNALHALAARRHHANVLHMAPILRHRPRRIIGASDSEGGGGDDSDADHTASNLSDLKGLNKYSALDMTLLSGSARRQTAKRAHYLTSLSIRDIIYDAKAAVLAFSRGGNTDAYKVKAADYTQAQDTVALLFAFRRLYHRSIYISRQRRVRASLRRARIAAVMALWKQSWAARASVERALEPRLVRIVEEMRVVKMRLALRRLHWYVHVSRREKEQLHRYGQRIRSKAVYLRALHTMRCKAYVKCFQALKQNYVSYSPSIAEQRRSDLHHADYAQRHTLRGWRQWYQARSALRRHGLRGEANQRALMGLLLHRANLWHLVQPGRHSGGVGMTPESFMLLPAVQQMHMTQDITRRCVQQLQLRRVLHRLRAVGRLRDV
jgi:hypothetical protein